MHQGPLFTSVGICTFSLMCSLMSHVCMSAADVRLMTNNCLKSRLAAHNTLNYSLWMSEQESDFLIHLSTQGMLQVTHCSQTSTMNRTFQSLFGKSNKLKHPYISFEYFLFPFSCNCIPIHALLQLVYLWLLMFLCS